MSFRTRSSFLVALAVLLLAGFATSVHAAPFVPRVLPSTASMVNPNYMVAPGLTGWAQIKYPYGASIEDAKQKLQYDLYYIKNQNLMLDATIMFETIKTILSGRGT